MATRFYRVNLEAGAYIDDLYYLKGDLVPLDDSDDDFKPPQWGTETDAQGNEIETGEGERESVQDRLATGLANRIAGKAVGGKPVAHGNRGTNKQTGKQTQHKSAIPKADLSDEQKAQVAESVTLLDPADASHWTEDGKPNAGQISELVGFTVTDDDIAEITPDVARGNA